MLVGECALLPGVLLAHADCQASIGVPVTSLHLYKCELAKQGAVGTLLAAGWASAAAVMTMQQPGVLCTLASVHVVILRSTGKALLVCCAGVRAWVGACRCWLPITMVYGSKLNSCEAGCAVEHAAHLSPLACHRVCLKSCVLVGQGLGQCCRSHPASCIAVDALWSLFSIKLRVSPTLALTAQTAVSSKKALAGAY